MDKRPLVREQIDAGGTFLREFEKYAPVGVAFWYRSDDDTSPALSMASPEYRDENIRDVYGEIVRIAAAMRNPNFEGGDVKMVGTGHRLEDFRDRLAREAVLEHERGDRTHRHRGDRREEFRVVAVHEGLEARGVHRVNLANRTKRCQQASFAGVTRSHPQVCPDQ